MAHEIRPCRSDELPQLNRLVNRVFRGGRAGDMFSEYPLLYSPENREQLRVIVVDGRIAAHVGILLRPVSLLGCTVKTAAIGSVCTDPDFRGQGLASELMEEARQHAVEQSASLMLISGTRGLYRRLGYVEAGAFIRFSVAASQEPAGIRIALLEDDDLGAAVRLHQQEAVRFVRSRDDWERLRAAGMLMNHQCEVFLARDGDRPVAYLAVRRTPGKDGDSDSFEVAEFAGSRAAIPAAMGQVAARYGVPSITLVGRRDDPGWEPAAGGPERSPVVPFDGTVGILHPGRFLAAVRPAFEERLGTGLAGLEFQALGERLTIRLGNESHEIGARGELAALVFGGETGDVQSLHACPAGIGRVLDRALPLPLPWYGFNYV